MRSECCLIDTRRLHTALGRSTEFNVTMPLKALENRVLRLEAEQGQVVTAAGAAATAAAATVAGGIISDAVTRITRLEGRAGQLESGRPVRLSSANPNSGLEV
jgi:hypothetical protein